MISSKNRLTNELLRSIYKDKKNPSVLRVNIDNVIKTLSMYNYNIPTIKFEEKLEALLNSKLVGIKITPGTPYVMAELIIGLAEKMHIAEDVIARYLTEHNSEEDVKALQEKIKDWRKKYYGSMDKAQKEALLNDIQGKMNENVINQIRKA